MATSRKEMITIGARRIGSRTGLVTSGTATTAVLEGLVNTTGDNTFYLGDRLLFLDATAESDKERLITGWDDATGTATFLARSVNDPKGESYILVNREDYTLNEFRLALNKAIDYTRLTYRRVIPATPNLDLYPLSDMDWLEGAGDIDAVFYNESPNSLSNEDFSLWWNGASAAPDNWTLTGGAVTQGTGGLRSAYYAQVANGTITQSFPQPLVQWLTRRIAPVYIPIRGAAWVVCNTPNTARVGIYDGSTTTWSDYHTGNGVPQFLSLSITPNAQQTEFTLVLDSSTGTSQFHAAVFMQNTINAPSAFQIRDAGSQYYYESEINYAMRNIGGVPTIELQKYPAILSQIVVYSRRPLPYPMTSDTDVVPNEFRRALTAGMLRFLLQANKPNQDRSRLDAIMTAEARVWTRFTNNAVSLPVPKPPVRYEIRGA
jgi:hypothetical protein